MYPLTITGLFYLFSSFEMSSEPTTSTDLPYKKLGKKKYQGAPKILNLALEYIQYLQHHIYIIRATGVRLSEWRCFYNSHKIFKKSCFKPETSQKT